MFVKRNLVTTVYVYKLYIKKYFDTNFDIIYKINIY